MSQTARLAFSTPRLSSRDLTPGPIALSGREGAADVDTLRAAGTLANPAPCRPGPTPMDPGIKSAIVYLTEQNPGPI